MSKEILDHIVLEYRVCSYCICRLHGFRDVEDLETCLSKLEILEPKPSNEGCKLCLNSIVEMSSLFNTLKTKLDSLEFETFLIGVMIPKKIIRLEEEIQKTLPSLIPLKIFVTNYFRKMIEEIFKITPDSENPDVSVIVDIKKRPRFNLQIKSIFIYGRYCKLVRGIPQTKWPCRNCKGKKCEKCDFTGLQYPNSVEMLIGQEVLDLTQGKRTKFHGAGREDIDALMLGTGRPFVLEITNPVIRTLNLKEIEIEINKQKEVQVLNLEFTTKSKVRYLKENASERRKIYRALIKVDQIVNQKDIDIIIKFAKTSQVLKQRTPHRVAHRRADKIREKTVYEIEILSFNTNIIELKITAGGGTYIKEFISGDEGRTNPSLTSLLGKDLMCIELDVVNVDE